MGIKKYTKILLKNLLPTILIIGSIVNLLVISQMNWAFRHNFYEDLQLRIVLVLLLGPIIGLIYVIAIFYAFRRKSSRSGREIFKILSFLHTPLYLFWLYLEPIGYNLLLILAPVIIVLSYIILGIYFYITDDEIKEFLNRKRNQYFITIILFLYLSFLLYGYASKYIILFGILLKVSLFLMFLFVPGFYLLKLVKKDYFDNNTAFLLSVPASITIFGLIFIVLQLYQSPPVLYLIFNLIFIASVIFISCRKKELKEIFNIDKTLKYGFVLIYIGSIMASSYVVVNMTEPQKDINGETVANRDLHNLPPDNNLQYETAITFANYRKPWSWGPNRFNMGDRPPLMGVLNSITALTLLIPKDYSFWYYEILGIILNILFLLPLVYIANKLFKNSKIVYLVPLAVLFNVFIFMNIYYTWPKLFGAYFILLPVVFLMHKKMSILTASIAGGLCGLGNVTHGAAVLSLPILFVFYSIYLLAKLKLNYFKFVAVFVGVFLLVNLSWVIYKQAHPEINTLRLIYHYLPDEYQPAPASLENLMRSFVKFFKEYPVEKQIEHRLANLKILAKNNSFPNTVKAVVSGDWTEYHDNVPDLEFTHPLTVFTGEIQILLSIIILLIYLLTYTISSSKKFSVPFNVKLIAFFVGVIILTYIFNVLAKWSVPRSHELPYFEPVMLIAIFAGISFSFTSAIRMISFGLICVRFSYNLIYTSLGREYHVLDFFNVVVVIGAIILIWIANRFSKEYA